VRRNRLSDFTHVLANGKIAMKLDEMEHGRLVSVRTCGPDDDVLLSTARGKCIRFPVTDVRVFSGRTSTGVRGIRLARNDEVIAMTVLRHAELDLEERDAYLRYAVAKRRAESGENGEAPCAPDDAERTLSQDRIEELEAGEQFLLCVAEDGLGKRTSAYEYRVAGRGGQGISNMDLSRAGGGESRVVGAFWVQPSDQLVLVTNAGKLIRCRVKGIRIAGRATRGVRLFDVADGERIVSAARLTGEATEEDDNGDLPQPDGDEA
jgi:DNA gyrase subunit A